MPSPAATSSFAIAKEIVNQLEEWKNQMKLKCSSRTWLCRFAFSSWICRKYDVIGYDINSKRVDELLFIRIPPKKLMN